jgi:RNA recognition motif-containing protein
VGGLNYLSLQSDIKSYFETFGKVTNCTLLVDKSSGKSRGFAFVTIEDPSKIISIINNILAGELRDKVLSRKHEINGKIVDVKLAVEGKKREEMLDSSKKIFVGGLDPTVTNGIRTYLIIVLDDLRNFFSNFGEVREAVVLFDNNRGASRCFGFVTFDSKETVDLLVKDNNYIIKGKPVDVKQALPKALQKVQ